MYDDKISVSIVTCVYNGDSFVDEYFENIVNLSDLIDQVIIINDGSVDNTLDKINSYADCLEFVEVYNKSNTGLPDSRNFSLSYVTSDYVIFLDIDDKLVKSSLISALRTLFYSDYDYLYGNVEYFTELNSNKNALISKIKSFFMPSPMLIKEKIFFNNSLVTPGALIFRMEILKDHKFAPDLTIGEDWEFFSRVIPKFNGFYLNEVLIKYFVHQGSMSSQLSSDSEKLDILKGKLINNYKNSSCKLSTYDYERFLNLNFNIFILKKQLATTTYSQLVKSIFYLFCYSKGFRFFTFFQSVKLMGFKVCN